MNKARRKELYAIANSLARMQNNMNAKDCSSPSDMLCDIKASLEAIFLEEEFCMDNIPENFQSSYRYQAAEEACDNLQCAIDELEEEDVDIQTVINYIYNATV